MAAPLGWARLALVNAGIVATLLASAVLAFELATNHRIAIQTTDTDFIDALAPARPSSSIKAILGGAEPRTYTFDQFGGRASATFMAYDAPRTIAMVGDSFSYGSENDYEDTAQAILQERFRGRANVLNFGKGGSSSIYYADTTRAFLDRFPRPIDALVVGIYTDMQIGDLPRVLAAQKSFGRYRYRGIAMSRASAQRLQSSSIARALFEAEIFLRRNSSAFNVLLPPQPSPEFAVSLRDMLSPEISPALMRHLLNNLRSLATITAVPPERTIIWLVASNHEAQQLLSERAGAARPAFFELSNRFWQQTKAALAAEGYAVADPRDLIIGDRVDRGGAPFTRSGHYTREAYQRTANDLIPLIEALLTTQTTSP